MPSELKQTLSLFALMTVPSSPGRSPPPHPLPSPCTSSQFKRPHPSARHALLAVVFARQARHRLVALDDRLHIEGREGRELNTAGTRGLGSAAFDTAG